jgi:mRNA-degrading endonuclease HigB of HigAB toxin-antitoxin module
LINKHAQHIQNKIVKKIHFSNDSNVKSVFSNEKKFFFLVKIDIEGDEYKIIKDIKNFSNKIHILIVEFHNLDKKRKLFKESIIFLKTLFNIIHIHGNNYCSLCKDNLPEVVEFTFLNKRIYPLNKKNFQKNFPIKKLDFPSYQFRKDYTLKFQ